MRDHGGVQHFSRGGEAERELEGGGGQTVSLGITTRWGKTSGGFQSLHSDGENNPIQGEENKKSTIDGEEMFQSMWETRVWINQADVFLLYLLLGKKKRKRK